MNTPKKKKKIGFWIAAVLILFVPLAVITVLLLRNLDPDLDKGSISSLTITMNSDEVEITERERIDFFRQIVENGVLIDESVTDLSSYRQCDLVFHKWKNDLKYTLYLSDSATDCLFIGESGALHLIPREYSQTLLADPLITSFAVTFAQCPCASVIDQDKVYTAESGSGDWTYQKADGNVTTVSSVAMASDAVLTAGSPLTLRFSIEPDQCRVRILDENDAIVYSGAIEEMPKLSFEEDTDLTLTVSAAWYEKETLSYHGAMEYLFHLRFDLPTVCTPSQTSVLPGQSITITIAHSDCDDTAVTATFPTSSVSVTKQGRLYIAAVSVSQDATPGDYKITLVGSDVDETIPIIILDN